MNEDVDFQVSGYADVEIADHVLTIAGGSGSVVVTIVDTTGAKLYVYDSRIGWRLRVDAGKEGETSKSRMYS
jgi:hypothetical protein